MAGPLAVTWEVRSARWHRGLLGTLSALGVLSTGYFAAYQRVGVYTSFLLLALLLLVLLATHQFHQAATGVLRWDGEHWHWQHWPDEPVGEVRCVLDLQKCVLVRLHAVSRGSVWLWLEASKPDERWHALRRAIAYTKGSPPDSRATPSAE